MPGNFLIAEELRRLFAEFAGEVAPGHSLARGVKASGYDPLQLHPVACLAADIHRLKGIPTDVPLEWRFGDYMAANAADLMTARALGSPNIGEAIIVAHRHQHVQATVRSFTLRPSGGGSATEVHHVAADDPVMRFVFHSLFAAKLAVIFRHYKGSDAQHQVDRRAPSFGSLLYRFGRDLDYLGIEFRDCEATLRLSREVMAQPLPDMGERQRKACDWELERKSAEVPAHMQWADRIRNHIRSSNFSDVSLSDVCDAYRVQRRSLSRLLRDEGTSFTAILTEMRREKALHLVRNTGVPLKRVAAELGFNSDASFNMAFKSWTGTTPMRFRKAEPARSAANDEISTCEPAAASPWFAKPSAQPTYAVGPAFLSRPLLATYRSQA